MTSHRLTMPPPLTALPQVMATKSLAARVAVLVAWDASAAMARAAAAPELCLAAIRLPLAA
ncbi:MAG: hypothetical protein K2X54_12370 [Methylobacterium organophilum]|nr:hypothetical protein [Methylobacterium organophilum]